MWRNYHKGVTEKEAKKFWAILPPEGTENLRSEPESFTPARAS
jgi:hypothetical protein